MEITLKLLLTDWLKETYPNNEIAHGHGGQPEHINIGGIIEDVFYLSGSKAWIDSPPLNPADPEFFKKIKAHVDGLVKEGATLSFYNGYRGISGFSGASGYSGFNGSISGYSGISGFSRGCDDKVPSVRLGGEASVG